MREIKSLEEMKSIELQILEKVHAFCAEQGIKYYLAYGTLIGAIRHHGFIPWDDDIDIWMKRIDYEKFIEKFPDWGKNHFLHLNCHKTTNGYNRVFAKVFDTRTIMVETDRNNKFNEGLFIDIFPLDGLTQNYLLKIIHLRKLQLLKNILTIKILKSENVQNKLVRICCTFLKRMFSGFDINKIVQSYENQKKLYNVSDAEEYSLMTGGGTKGLDKVILAQYFSGSQMIEFEKKEFFIPKGYDAILKTIYGDYMQLPPVEKQVPHHNMKVYWKN